MLEFSKSVFDTLLKSAPSKRNTYEECEFSLYLQKHVFDKFLMDEEVALAELDFNAFELSHVIPEGYSEMYRRTSIGWAKGFNKYLKDLPAIFVNEKSFF